MSKLTKHRVIIRADRCNGCNLCVVACATGNLHLDDEHLNAKGFNPAVWSWKGDKGNCTGCENCYWVCPDAAIEAVLVVKEAAA